MDLVWNQKPTAACLLLRHARDLVRIQMLSHRHVLEQPRSQRTKCIGTCYSVKNQEWYGEWYAPVSLLQSAGPKYENTRSLSGTNEGSTAWEAGTRDWTQNVFVTWQLFILMMSLISVTWTWKYHWNVKYPQQEYLFGPSLVTLFGFSYLQMSPRIGFNFNRTEIWRLI